MIRHVSAVAIGLCLSASLLSAQTAEPRRTEFTVTIASAEVHKFATVASPVIGRAPRGTALEISRNLGSWVEVPWPGAEDGIAFVHVNAGVVTSGVMPALLVPGSAAPTTSAAGAEQISAADQSGATRQMYVSLPRHTVGLGGRMSASGPGFGATGRMWWGKRLGLQLEMSRYVLNSVAASGHMRSIQFAPSILYALPDGLTGGLWLRPYLGAGGNFYRSTLSSGLSGSDSSVDKGLGLQAFGGTEATFSGAPRLVVSADLAYRWSRTSFVGFEPSKVALSLSGHWYVK
jgi:hypothetical protein